VSVPSAHVLHLTGLGHPHAVDEFEVASAAAFPSARGRPHE